MGFLEDMLDEGSKETARVQTYFNVPYEVARAWVATGAKDTRNVATDPMRWAEGLIRQLPATHEGRNSWLLNHGFGPDVEIKREAHKTYWYDQAEKAGGRVDSFVNSDRVMVHCAMAPSKTTLNLVRHWGTYSTAGAAARRVIEVCNPDYIEPWKEPK